ncbi:hypothetical protein Leryth_019996 [Lithospermum erythrorhizon]|nr:hypothetical protein Leryth_019996 [Lithospermum erythrorhizon]
MTSISASSSFFTPCSLVITPTSMFFPPLSTTFKYSVSLPHLTQNVQHTTTSKNAIKQKLSRGICLIESRDTNVRIKANDQGRKPEWSDSSILSVLLLKGSNVACYVFDGGRVLDSICALFISTRASAFNQAHANSM